MLPTTLRDLVFDFWRATLERSPAKAAWLDELMESWVLPTLGDLELSDLQITTMVSFTQELIAAAPADEAREVMRAVRETLLYGSVVFRCENCNSAAFRLEPRGVSCMRCGMQF